MKLFDPSIYSGVANTAEHARQIAAATDKAVDEEGEVYYGRIEDGKVVDLTREQKPGDTVAMLMVVWKYLKKISPRY